MDNQIPQQNAQVAPAQTQPQTQSAQQTTSTPQSQTSSNKMGKILLLILGILIITAATATAFFIMNKPQPTTKITNKPVVVAKKTSPTPDPTENWQTYIDTNNNYTFKYPPDWEEVNDPNIPMPLFGPIGATDKYRITFVGPTIFNKGGTSIPKKVLSTENIVIAAGYNATKETHYMYYTGGNEVLETVVTVHNVPLAPDLTLMLHETKGTLEITAWSKLDTEKDRYADTFNKILSTITFTNQVIISQTLAIQLVQNAPGIKAFLAKTTSGKIALQGENKDKTAWVIHIYEDFPDHQATFGWYTVNKTTGKIIKTSQ